MKLALLSLATLLWFVPTASHATSVVSLPSNGKLLVAECRLTVEVMDAAGTASEDKTFHSQFCGDYLQGYSDALASSRNICKGKDVANGDMVRAYLLFMEKHQGYLELYQGDGVRAALIANYSCVKSHGR